MLLLLMMMISESKAHPITCHEGTEGEIAA
jgi:hypothetical protein